jgi:membrane protease YdiL (CAAX protease family)
MHFDGSPSFFDGTKGTSRNPDFYWTYEDIGVFSLILTVLRPILEVFVRLHLLAPSELKHASFSLQLGVIVFLMLALCLIPRIRYHRPVLLALGWIWPHPAYVIVAPFLGALLAGGLAICLHGQAQNKNPEPLAELVMLGVFLGPILEESFFRGCLLPVLAGSVGKSLAVILSSVVFALFHSPGSAVHWTSFIGSGLIYGWIRLTSRSTTASALSHAAYNLVVVLFAKS